MDISILTTASGILGLLVTVLAIFLKPTKIKEISKKDMASVIIWLALMVLGFVDLHHTYGPGDTISGNSISSSTISNNARFIIDHYDQIKKLKASYSDADTETIKNNKVDLHIVEKAGIVYRNLQKTGKPTFLTGADVPSAKVIFLDYFSDDIIYSCTSKKEAIPFVPPNHDKFYCVVVHDDYDFHVSHPIQTTEDEETDDNSVDIQLDKKGATYTPLSQIHLYMQDPGSDGSYTAIPSGYVLLFHCTSISDGESHLVYDTKEIPASVILSCYGEYFSLNTDYEMDLTLCHQSDKNKELAHQTFKGPVQNSTMTDVVFELDNKNGTSE